MRVHIYRSHHKQLHNHINCVPNWKPNWSQLKTHWTTCPLPPFHQSSVETNTATCSVVMSNNQCVSALPRPLLLASDRSGPRSSSRPPELRTIPDGRVAVGAWDALLVPRSQKTHPQRERAGEPRKERVQLPQWRPGVTCSLDGLGSVLDRYSSVSLSQSNTAALTSNKSVQTNICLQLKSYKTELDFFPFYL